MLIAMMSESYSNVQSKSFMNYAYFFAGLLVLERCPSGIGSSPSPLNLLSVPYYTAMMFRDVVRFLRDEVRSPEPVIGARGI